MAKKIIYAVTVSKSLKLLNGKLNYLSNKGFNTAIITSPGNEIEKFQENEITKVIPVLMQREISLFNDFLSLVKLTKVILKEKPQIVNAGTPKAGLLVTLASFVCRVPIRIYTVRGLRLETTTGFKRKILLFTEKIAANAATHVVCISPSLKEKVIDLNIVNDKKISVIRKGSSNGYNIEKNEKAKVSLPTLNSLKQRLGILENDFIIGFVGRLTNDKGVNEVLEVFKKVSRIHANVKLLILGDFEESDSISAVAKKELNENEQIIFEGYQKDLVPYYQIMDTFLFLSKREGFGNVVVEAALNNVPAIVGNITGVKDTVIDNRTGFIVEREDTESCIKKVVFLISNESERKRLGENAAKWASENFDSQLIWKDYHNFYIKLLESVR